MIVTVFTNDNHLWLLQGFAYLFNRFWGKTQKVRVVGFNPPKFKLPTNFEFYSLGDENFPVGSWSNALMKYLYECEEDRILLMLEDYWLYEQVDHILVNNLYDCYNEISMLNTILRIDLTNDRSSRNQKRLYGKFCGRSIIETPSRTPYQMSYQAAIWDVKTLFDILEPNENPWQSEINGTERLKKRENIKVLGTEDRPLVYQPVYRTHRQVLQTNKIPQPIIHELEERGCLP